MNEQQEPRMKSDAETIESLQSQLAEAKSESEFLAVIDERDSAEEAMSQAYFLITGRSPEWSNLFGHKEALEEIDDAQRLLRESNADLKGEISKLQYVIREMRKALQDIQWKAELGHWEEGGCSECYRHDDKEGHADDCSIGKALKLTPDSLPPLYTEEQVRPLVEYVQCRIKTVECSIAAERLANNQYKLDKELSAMVELRGIEAALSTFQRKERG